MAIKNEEVKKVEETNQMDKVLAELAKLKEENSELKLGLDSLNKKTVSVNVESVVDTSKTDYLNERVAFIAMRDEEKYKDDIVVGINGKNFVIQRGKHVMIPRYVHDAIMNSYSQEFASAMANEKLKEEYNTKKKQLI